MKIPKSTAQKKISVIWFVNAGILALIFVLFTVFDKFDGRIVDGWSWYSQTIVPTLTLILAAFAYSLNHSENEKLVDIFYFKLVKYFSIGYFTILYITILLAPVTFKIAATSIIDYLKNSIIFISILQGIVAYSLGLFFMNESKTSDN
jgi:hypothetical protein